MSTTPLFIIGAAEGVILATLLLPLSPLNSLGIGICGIAKVATGKVVCLTVAAFLFAFTCAGMSAAMRPSPADSNSPDDFCDSIQTALIAGVDLVLGYVLIVLSSLMEKSGRLQISHDVLKRQAEQTQVAYMALLENQNGEGNSEGGDDKELAAAQAQVRTLQERCNGLEAEKMELEERCNRAETDTEAMKRQSE
ncbi:hypothetical protein CYMTET_30761, partial [Cymbomonas tetramitiformis]